MKPPIVLQDRDGWLSVFDSPEAAEGYVESPDIEADEDLVWDSESRRLFFEVVPPPGERDKPSSGDLPLGLRWVAVHPVKLREAPDPRDPQGLRAALLEGLGRFEKAEWKPGGTDASEPDPGGRRGLRPSATGALPRLAIPSWSQLRRA